MSFSFSISFSSFIFFSSYKSFSSSISFFFDYFSFSFFFSSFSFTFSFSFFPPSPSPTLSLSYLSPPLPPASLPPSFSYSISEMKKECFFFWWLPAAGFRGWLHRINTKNSQTSNSHSKPRGWQWKWLPCMGLCHTLNKSVHIILVPTHRITPNLRTGLL
jgi:hypothetical protein